MKSQTLLIACSLALLTACTSQYQARNYDDLYYSTREKKVDDHSFVVKPSKVEAEPVNSPESGSTGQWTGASTPSQNNDSTQQTMDQGYSSDSYFMDDYYDYAYSARMRRFHDNHYYGSYYSDYYTNSYWYDYNPWNWGTSIYMGYNWGYPGLYSSWYYPGYSWGGYYDWWNPYYSYGGFGYNYGYWNGYYDGYWNGYYGGGWAENNYGNGGHNGRNYHGHRGSVGTSGGLAGNSRGLRSGSEYDNQLVRGSNYNDRNQSVASGNARGSRNDGNATDPNQTAQTNSQRNTVRNQPEPNPQRGSMQNAGNMNPSNSRNEEGNTGSEQVRNASQAGSTAQNERQQSAYNERTARYVYQRNPNGGKTQPEQGLKTRGSIQPYSSPTYTKPRSGQEYTAPKYRNTPPSNEQRTTASPSGGSNQRSSQGQDNRTYSAPSNNRSSQPANNQGRTNASPNRSNENRSTPSRSNYSTPTRSSESSSPSRSNSNYSAPSRSSESSSPSRSNSSYSAPSRSSESSSPSRSSGSSGSGSSGSGSGHRR
ncbi:MAG: hypothetical protein IPH88_08960 [Bacteroidales bacterium]|nr:hypothetical protein [Bacteroidales bacterium]